MGYRCSWVKGGSGVRGFEAFRVVAMFNSSNCLKNLLETAKLLKESGLTYKFRAVV